MNAQLEVGAVTESVQVAASLDLVQTSTAKVSTAVSNKMVDELPLVVGGAMRGVFDLALITPEANQPNDEGFNVGGGQGGGYGATLDGVSVLTGRFNSVQWTNVNTPSVDAITEFAVETNGFKAEYGRAQGGMMTFTSKSGTNKLSGTLYEFLRNDALDSRRFFEDRRGKYKQHDFGWSVGGPVYIPELYDGRNKTFFFASGEWFRNRIGGTIDHYNRRLEKSIGEFDLTHNIKMTYIYELPIGKGKRWLTSGPASWVLGNWRIAGSHYYASGYPLSLSNSAALGGVLFNGRSAATIGTYDDWIVNKDNADWKGADRFFQAPSFFGAQPTDRAGNSTRHNPKARQHWNLSENYSLAKSFPIRESVRMDLRWEMFNLFNRFRPSTGSTNLQDPNFGRVQGQLNEPRRMQLGLKLYF